MGKTGMSTLNNRIRTIDVLRALTMFLMIFVNDLWSLTGVPKWLGHTLAEEDGMGFSDIIFPLFLFIVGLSIPLAIEVRFKKNESRPIIIRHILTRTIALLVMGFYMVNFGVINQEAMGLNKSIWQILMATAISFIWMDYKRLPNLSKISVMGLKIAGILLLAYLAFIYRGGTAENITWMQPRWWGILGLIGWAYLLNSLLYLFGRGKIIYLLTAFLLLLFLNIQENGFFEFLPKIKFVISASNHVLVMAGMLCTIFYLKIKKEGRKINQFLGVVILVSGFFVLYGFLIRPAFPISKILATPSWTAICIGISLLLYTICYFLVDRYGYHKWTNPIKPAGTSTLTCYLMPYIIYPALVLFGFEWPDFISDGIVGLIKSLLFSLSIILIVGGLEKCNIHLKV